MTKREIMPTYDMPQESVDKEAIVKDVYLTAMGYKPKLRIIDIPDIQEFFYEYGKTFFQKKEWSFLDAFIFSNDKGKQNKFNEKYPGCIYLTRHSILITRLEMAYYGITRLFDMEFCDKDAFSQKYGKNFLTDEEFLFWRCYLMKDDECAREGFRLSYPESIFPTTPSIMFRSNSVTREIYQKLDLAYQKYCSLFNEPKIPDDVLTNSDEEIDFEHDILPNLRFFSKRDATFLKAFYQERLQYEEIVKQYQRKRVSGEAVQRLKYHINELKRKILALKQANGTRFRFDFDVYRKMVESGDLPFNGDYYNIKNCFESLLGENADNYSIKDLGYPYFQYEKWQMQCLALSTYRLQNGINKDRMFTKDDVLNYMLDHQKNMNDLRRKKYRQCIDVFESEDIDDDIVFDLLKEQYPYFFDFDTIDQNGVEYILSNWGTFLEPDTVEYLMKYYKIDRIPNSSELRSYNPMALAKLNN